MLITRKTIMYIVLFCFYIFICFNLIFVFNSRTRHAINNCSSFSSGIDAFHHKVFARSLCIQIHNTCPIRCVVVVVSLFFHGFYGENIIFLRQSHGTDTDTGPTFTWKGSYLHEWHKLETIFLKMWTDIVHVSHFKWQYYIIIFYDFLLL